MKSAQSLLLVVILFGLFPQTHAQSPASHHFEYVYDRFGRTTDILFFEDSVLTDSFDVGAHNPYGFLPYPRSQRYDEWPSYKLDSFPFWDLARKWLPTFIEDSLELIKIVDKENLDFTEGFSTFSCTHNDHFILVLYDFQLYGETIQGQCSSGLVLNAKGELVHHVHENDQRIGCTPVLTDNGRFLAFLCGDLGPDNYFVFNQEGVEILDLEKGETLIQFQKHPSLGYWASNVLQAGNKIAIVYNITRDSQYAQVIDPTLNIAYEKVFSFHGLSSYIHFANDATIIRRYTGEIIRIEPYAYFFEKKKWRLND